jgi:hypothetical protein
MENDDKIVFISKFNTTRLSLLLRLNIAFSISISIARYLVDTKLNIGLETIKPVVDYISSNSTTNVQYNTNLSDQKSMELQLAACIPVDGSQALSLAPVSLRSVAIDLFPLS